MKSTTRCSLLALVLLLAAPLSFAQDTDHMQSDQQMQSDQMEMDEAMADANLVAALEAEGDFTTLVQALRDTGLDQALSTNESFTLFAPTDEAFAKLPEGTLASLSPDQLTTILRYHLVAGSVTSSQAAELDAAPTVQGSDLTIAATGDGLTVNDATVVRADIAASNGTIHAIDTVLMPETASEATMSETQMMKDTDEMAEDTEEME